MKHYKLITIIVYYLYNGYDEADSILVQAKSTLMQKRFLLPDKVVLGDYIISDELSDTLTMVLVKSYIEKQQIPYKIKFQRGFKWDDAKVFTHEYLAKVKSIKAEFREQNVELSTV